MVIGAVEERVGIPDQAISRQHTIVTTREPYTRKKLAFLWSIRHTLLQPVSRSRHFAAQHSPPVFHNVRSAFSTREKPRNMQRSSWNDGLPRSLSVNSIPCLIELERGTAGRSSIFQIQAWRGGAGCQVVARSRSIVGRNRHRVRQWSWEQYGRQRQLCFLLDRPVGPVTGCITVRISLELVITAFPLVG